MIFEDERILATIQAIKNKKESLNDLSKDMETKIQKIEKNAQKMKTLEKEIKLLKIENNNLQLKCRTISENKNYEEKNINMLKEDLFNATMEISKKE